MFWLKIAKYALIPLFMLGAGLVYKQWPWIPQDNAIEELIEQGLKDQTGYDVDISPDTPEDKNGNK
jgi:hypothetical protein